MVHQLGRTNFSFGREYLGMCCTWRQAS